VTKHATENVLLKIQIYLKLRMLVVLHTIKTSYLQIIHLKENEYLATRVPQHYPDMISRYIAVFHGNHCCTTN
jgi:hypothetical protein